MLPPITRSVQHDERPRLAQGDTAPRSRAGALGGGKYGVLQPQAAVASAAAPPASKASPLDTPPPGEETDHYEVREVVDHRGGAGGRREYRVAWVGYSDEYNTWEPWGNLAEHAGRMLREYQWRSRHAVLSSPAACEGRPLKHGWNRACSVRKDGLESRLVPGFGDKINMYQHKADFMREFN